MYNTWKVPNYIWITYRLLATNIFLALDRCMSSMVDQTGDTLCNLDSKRKYFCFQAFIFKAKTKSGNIENNKNEFLGIDYTT